MISHGGGAVHTDMSLYMDLCIEACSGRVLEDIQVLGRKKQGLAKPSEASFAKGVSPRDTAWRSVTSNTTELEA